MIQAIIWTDVLSLAITLFLVMDPLGNTPVFHSILNKYQLRRKIRIIVRELIIALVILLVFLISGTRILGFLGLTQPTLSLAGGILLFIIAIRMVFPGQSPLASDVEDDPFIVPLAMPLVAGPSAIAILILQSTSEPDRMFEWVISLLLAWTMTTVILISTPFIMSFFGNRGVRALERLMGMILILLAVQMFLNGVTDYVKNYL